ncbi:30s ribosomal protein s13 [Moniliophthora roreri MCA 2997]|uniref:Small ribosomal subunit protein uS13m n=1 Tax=Moniliophthora roreri (strain MCA 2997) TaxID=1381753 RepID=V2XBI5_MONRO|nr:30s ribosomal protein s13 [Moniliophthora roreri MCA 2997]
MVHILGINLPDDQLARFALTSIYGIGHHMSHRLCARFQIHDKCKIKDLTPFQVTALASFLSSPKTAPPLSRYPLAPPNFHPAPPNRSNAALLAELNKTKAAELREHPNAKVTIAEAKIRDPLNELVIETELRRQVRENIHRQRSIGSYVGLRHAMGLPVRGQNTQTNAKTAKKLNRLDRY